MGAMGPRTGYGARTSQGAGPIEAPFSPTRVGSGSLCACVAVTGRGPVGRTATEDKRRWVVAVRWSVVAGPAGLSSPADPHGGFHSAGPHRGFHPAARTGASTPWTPTEVNFHRPLATNQTNHSSLQKRFT